MRSRRDARRLVGPGSAATPEMRLVLSSAEDDAPSAAQLREVAGHLAPLFASPLPGVGAAAAVGLVAVAPSGAAAGVLASKGVASALLIKLVVASVAVSGGVVAGYGAGHAIVARPHRERTATALVPPRPTPRVDPAPLALEPPHPPVIARTRRTRRAPSSLGVGAAPERETPPVPEPEASEPPEPRATPSPVPSAIGHRELAILERAHRALRGGEFGEALALVAEHERAFAAGALSQEREVIAIDAWVQSHRIDEARERVDRFRAAYPNSGHLTRLDALLARGAARR